MERMKRVLFLRDEHWGIHRFLISFDSVFLEFLLKW
jgi:hypothetical protein